MIEVVLENLLYGGAIQTHLFQTVEEAEEFINNTEDNDPDSVIEISTEYIQGEDY